MAGQIAVDLTPIGRGDGRSRFVVGLIRELARTASETQWLLLTSASSHEALRDLDARNLSRRCVLDDRRSGLAARKTAQRELRRYARRVVHTILPGRGMGLTARVAHMAEARRKPNTLVRDLGADWLFCPFTTPTYWHPAVPCAVVVDDAHHPYARRACAVANKVICLGDVVREGLVAQGLASSDKLIVIGPGSLEPAHNVIPEAPTDTLLCCSESDNHQMLLTAFGIFQARHPDSRLKLVFADEGGAWMRSAAERMGLSEYVRFVARTSGIAQTCRAVIVPSLGEGIAWPVLEALAAGKPVLCSDVAALHELAHDAALYFDPRRPFAIAEAIEVAVTAPHRMAELHKAAQRRRDELGKQTTAMAAQFLTVFREAAVAR